MSSACLIGDFRILRPKHRGEHGEAVRWLATAHARAEVASAPRGFDEDGFRARMERLVSRYGCNPEHLEARGFEVDDFLHTRWGTMRVFDVERDPNGAGMAARMDAFQEVAERAFDAFYPETGGTMPRAGSDPSGHEPEPPAELIHVSCTGYAAPSAPQKLVARKGWRGRTGVVHAYHMGCYASMPALRMATAFLASPRAAAPRTGRDSGRASTAARGAGAIDEADEAGSAPALGELSRRIDIVHTEFCSLHLNPSLHQPEQLVVQSLFADGHIRYSVGPDEGGGGFRYLGVHEEILPDTGGAIGWHLGDYGMRITLAREVPDLIAGALGGFLGRLFESAGADPDEALERGLFAVHPGGPRIIDKVAGLLRLRPEQVSHSRAVLKECGNMSSATLPHVWAAMLDDDAVPSGTLVTSLAFGPGLTLYGAMLRKA